MGNAVEPEVKYLDLDISYKFVPGVFGNVHKARHKIHKDRVYAVKKRPISETHLARKRALRDIQAETTLLERVKGDPNVVRYFGFMPDDQYVCFVLEYCDGGNLKQYLSCGGFSQDRDLIDFCCQITEGLSFIHCNGLTHGDIRPESILVHGNQCKISKLGFASALEKIVGQDEYKELCCKVHTSNGGKSPYWAPEVYEGGLHEMKDSRSDVFSLGIVFLFMSLCETEKKKRVQRTTHPFTLAEIDTDDKDFSEQSRMTQLEQSDCDVFDLRQVTSSFFVLNEFPALHDDPDRPLGQSFRRATHVQSLIRQGLQTRIKWHEQFSECLWKMMEPNPNNRISCHKVSQSLRARCSIL